MNIICKECGTENEQEYTYCKNCGAKLEIEEPKKEEPPHYNQPERPSYTNSFDEPFYDGVTSTEMTLFIGKKANDILPKFQKMKITGSKVSWCWPLAILSFLFGPFGAAFWFFYRKMYKYAFIFSGIGFVLSAIVTALTFKQTNLINDGLIEAFSNGNFQAFINSLESTETILTSIASGIENITYIATAVATGIFGNYIYMKHSIEKINSYKFGHSDPRFYQMGLTAIGGTSGGMLALGLFLKFGSDAILKFISSIISLMI